MNIPMPEYNDNIKVILLDGNAPWSVRPPNSYIARRWYRVMMSPELEHHIS